MDSTKARTFVAFLCVAFCALALPAFAPARWSRPTAITPNETPEERDFLQTAVGPDGTVTVLSTQGTGARVNCPTFSLPESLVGIYRSKPGSGLASFVPLSAPNESSVSRIHGIASASGTVTVVWESRFCGVEPEQASAIRMRRIAPDGTPGPTITIDQYEAPVVLEGGKLAERTLAVDAPAVDVEGTTTVVAWGGVAVPSGTVGGQVRAAFVTPDGQVGAKQTVGEGDTPVVAATAAGAYVVWPAGTDGHLLGRMVDTNPFASQLAAEISGSSGVFPDFEEGRYKLEEDGGSLYLLWQKRGSGPVTLTQISGGNPGTSTAVPSASAQVRCCADLAIGPAQNTAMVLYGAKGGDHLARIEGGRIADDYALPIEDGAVAVGEDGAVTAVGRIRVGMDRVGAVRLFPTNTARTKGKLGSVCLIQGSRGGREFALAGPGSPVIASWSVDVSGQGARVPGYTTEASQLEGSGKCTARLSIKVTPHSLSSGPGSFRLKIAVSNRGESLAEPVRFCLTGPPAVLKGKKCTRKPLLLAPGASRTAGLIAVVKGHAPSGRHKLTLAAVGKGSHKKIQVILRVP
jgi:hypothetical protein